MSVERHGRASRGWFTRFRAVLAGCLVLGVGGAVTLAAWTDEEHASGTFTAGEFNIEGSVDGTIFDQHPEGAAAELGFALPEATQMLPGTVVYAPFTVRTTEGSVAGAVTFTASSANSSGLGEYLTYGVAQVTGTACDEDSFAAGTSLVPTGSSLTTSADTYQELPAAAEDPVTYCLRVELPSDTPNAAQGAALEASWTVAATTDTQ